MLQISIKLLLRRTLVHSVLSSATLVLISSKKSSTYICDIEIFVVKKFYFSVIILFAISFAATAQSRAVSTMQKTLIDTSKQFSLRVLPSDYYSSNVGFFCKKELQLQDALKIPLRFRLGSVAYCDAMEGKNNSHP